jgi:hypothetical protein
MPPSFPEARLRQAGIGSARISALRAEYDAATPARQEQLRRTIAGRPDEILRRTYGGGDAGDEDGPGTPLNADQLAALLPTRLSDAELRTLAAAVVAAARDTDPEREAFIPARLAAEQLRAGFGAPLLSTKRPAALAPALRAPSRIGAAGHGWTGGAGDDTAVKLLGDLSYRAVTNGAGGSLYLSAPVYATAQDWSRVTPRLIARVDDPSRIQTFALNITTGTGNVFTASVPTTSLTPNDWHVLTVPRGLFTIAAGAPVWTGVTRAELRFQDKGGAAPLTVWTHGVDLLPDRAETYPNGVMVLEADDGYASQGTLLRGVAESVGAPVTLPLIAERVTSGGNLTLADLRSMERAGHQLACHAHTVAFHGNAGATAEQAEGEFVTQQRWYEDNGLPFGALDYALCPGTGSPVPEGAKLDALRRHFRSVRVNSGFYDSTVPADPHRLRSVLFTGDSNANLQTHIDRMSVPGGVFVLALHEVIAGGTNGTASGLPAISVNNLRTVLQYAASKGMAFRTRADYLAGR